MNKYLILGILIVVLLGGGVAYKKYGKGEGVALTGETKEFVVFTQKGKWNFSPDIIVVNEGDRVHLTIINEDEYDHGFAIDQFGVSQRIPARGTVKIEFVATSAGEWPYYCSVSCGEGIVDNKPRGHFDQIGKLKVNSKDTPMYGGEMKASDMENMMNQ